MTAALEDDTGAALGASAVSRLAGRILQMMIKRETERERKRVVFVGQSKTRFNGCRLLFSLLLQREHV